MGSKWTGEGGRKGKKIGILISMSGQELKPGLMRNLQHAQPEPPLVQTCLIAPKYEYFCTSNNSKLLLGLHRMVSHETEHGLFPHGSALQNKIVLKEKYSSCSCHCCYYY